MPEGCKIRFAKIKLQESANVYLIFIENKEKDKEPIGIWVEMKEEVRKKYIPSTFRYYFLN